MSLVNQLLLNTLIVITPILLYQVLWIDRQEHPGRLHSARIITVACMAVALLCMAFPFELYEGLLYDFRLVPLALCFLYAGPFHALGVAAVILLYRMVLGGTGAYIQPLILLLACLLLIGVSRWYWSGDKRELAKKAFILGCALSLVSVLATWLVRWYEGSPLLPPFFVYFPLYCLLLSGTLSLAVLLVEQIKENVKRRNLHHRADKMNVLGELAASFAHEIRNPLTVAKGFMQMLKHNELTEEKRKIYSQMVLEELIKAQSIVNDYMTFARPQLEAVERLDAKPLILKALGTLESYARLSNVSLDVQLDEKLMINANKEKFIQCIVHLCRNGIEAMPGGGCLKVIGAVHSRSVCIDIIDQGVGMTEEEIRRLGTPYYTTRGKGTGLGMMVTYRAIQTIHGRIDVTSQVGKGTCFSIMIPSVQSSSYH